MVHSRCTFVCFLAFLGVLTAIPSSLGQEPNNTREQIKPMVFEGSVGGWRVLEEGQPPAMIHATVEDMKRFREANPHGHPASNSNELSYHGGIGGIGVETAPKVFLVLWGSQWNNNDPSGESAILQSFYNGVGGSSWANSVTQYCQGVPSGTVFCNGGGQAAGNPNRIFAGVWADNTSLAPSHPRQSQLAAEAGPRCAALRQHHCSQQRERAVRDRHRDGTQQPRIWIAILRLPQRDQLLGRQCRLHESAVHHRRRWQLWSQLQRPGPRRRHYHRWWA